MTFHRCSFDYYYSIDADGEFAEGHILATLSQAAAIEKAIIARMAAMGYSKPEVRISLGGEYDYAYDEEDDDYEAYAKDIIDDGGFAIQDWSTLKEEE